MHGCVIVQNYRFVRDLFPNEKNARIGNWQIATDTLIAIIKAQRQFFSNGCKGSITRNICDIPSLKNK